MAAVLDGLPAEVRNPALRPFGEPRPEDGVPVRHHETGTLADLVSEDHVVSQSRSVLP
jgi:hypothetical protein